MHVYTETIFCVPLFIPCFFCFLLFFLSMCAHLCEEGGSSDQVCQSTKVWEFWLMISIKVLATMKSLFFFDK
jgi:hypothetical protein